MSDAPAVDSVTDALFKLEKANPEYPNEIRAIVNRASRKAATLALLETRISMHVFDRPMSPPYLERFTPRNDPESKLAQLAADAWSKPGAGYGDGPNLTREVVQGKFAAYLLSGIVLLFGLTIIGGIWMAFVPVLPTIGSILGYMGANLGWIIPFGIFLAFVFALLYKIAPFLRLLIVVLLIFMFPVGFAVLAIWLVSRQMAHE